MSQLKEDNKEIQEYIDSGQDRKKLNIEELNGDEDHVIEMTLGLGVLEANYKEHHAAPLDDTPLPTKGWRNATNE